ncbi:hypothetical protein ACFRDV_26510 [Streptomyces fagopyri]|uniref:hypothetical protein n=1 Tax=Streptomyces fagopyri TaxID=2662397 RepID=UPI003695A779
MRPEDTQCAVLKGDLGVATRTYEQQQRTQHLDRQQHVVHGVWLLGYGTGGSLVAWRATRCTSGS